MSKKQRQENGINVLFNYPHYLYLKKKEQSFIQFKQKYERLKKKTVLEVELDYIKAKSRYKVSKVSAAIVSLVSILSAFLLNDTIFQRISTLSIEYDKLGIQKTISKAEYVSLLMHILVSLDVLAFLLAFLFIYLTLSKLKMSIEQYTLLEIILKKKESESHERK